MAKVLVKKFNGTDWEDVGNSENTLGYISNGANRFMISFEFDSNGYLFIAYADESDSGKMKVKKLDTLHNGVWIDATDMSGINSRGVLMSLAINQSNGDIFLAYTENPWNDWRTKITIKKLNQDTWETIAQGLGYYSTSWFKLSVNPETNELWLTFADIEARFINPQENYYAISVMKNSDSGWEYVGEKRFATYQGGLNLIFEPTNKEMLLSYQTTRNVFEIKTFESGTWQSFVDSMDLSNETDQSRSYEIDSETAFTPEGKIYLAHGQYDSINNNHSCVVSKWDGSRGWIDIGKYCNDSVWPQRMPSLLYSDGKLFLSKQDSENGYKLSVIKKVENHAPTITLLGDNPLTLLVGKTFANPGATAFDEEDGDISANNIVVGDETVNVNEAGTYIVTYNVVDSGGVSAEEITRIVKVQTLAERAIELAKSVIGAPYLGDGITWGGKGWNGTRYVEIKEIKEGYDYYNAISEKEGKVEFGAGVDCSGLTLWAFNKGNDAKNYPEKKNGYCPDCPIGLVKADKQYRLNTVPITKTDLQPGDLLFFNETQDIKDVLTHVMLYAGNFEYEGEIYNVIHSMIRTGEISPAFYDVNNEMLTTKGTDFKPKITAYGRLKKPDDGIYWYVMQSPATMIITDPDGEVVSKDNLESVSMEYSSYDIDGDGEIEDMVMVALKKDGEYKIQVIPKENALPNDTFTLEIATFDSTIEIAKDIKISDIPEHGYIIKVSQDQIIPEMNVDIDIRPYSESNKIIFNSKKDFSVGLIPVAILSSDTINTPKDINLESLTFGKTGYENSLKHCLPAKIDINKDGLTDLVCFFEAPKTELNQDDKFGVLRGMTKTEKIFIGIDNIQIISPHFWHQSRFKK